MEFLHSTTTNTHHRTNQSPYRQPSMKKIGPSYSMVGSNYDLEISNITNTQKKIPSEPPKSFLVWGIQNWWLLEFLSWFIAVLSTITIIITLQLHDRKPLPQWPFSITLNALVSIFATTCQMAIMQPVSQCLNQLKWLWFSRPRKLSDFQAFDDASRGTMGSLTLAIKLRCFDLGSLGAIITIASLGFGPFAQQVLTYPLRTIVIGNSSTPQVIQYNNTGGPMIEITLSDPQDQASLYEGIAGTTASLSDVRSSCTTANCTWESYPSLGVCATVVDVSKFLVNSTCDQCFDYSLPTSYWDSSGSLQSVNLKGNSGQFMGFYPAGTKSLASFRWPLVDFYFLYQNLTINSTVPLFPPVVLEIALGFCVQTYNTSVISSNTQTTMIAADQIQLTSLGTTISSPVAGYEFEIVRDLELQEFLSDFFNGSCSEVDLFNLNRTVIGQIPSCDTNTALAFLSVASKTADAKPGIEALMNNVAISMTNQFRLGGGGNTKVVPFLGKALSSETYVKAEYEWLILHISLILLTLIFLLATISRNECIKSDVWKSSTLATMQGLDNDLHRKLGVLGEKTSIEERSKNVRVVIRGNEEEGWRFVECL